MMNNPPRGSGHRLPSSLLAVSELRETWLECSKCSEAPPGAPPCVFCSFAQPIYFAGILNASLGVCNCANCGVDGRVCGVCSGYHRRHHYATRTMSPPPSNDATPIMPRHSSGLTQLSDSYVEDPVIPTSRMMGFDESYYHSRKLYYHPPGTMMSSPPNEGRRTVSPRIITSPGYFKMQSRPLSTSGQPLLRRIPSTRTDATDETAFSSDRLSRATADSASIEARQTLLLSMGQARQAGFLGADGRRLQPELIRPSLGSSSPPLAAFSTQPLRLRETTWSSRQTPHDGRTSDRRSYQVTQVDTVDDAIYRENSTTTRMTPASSRQRSHHMQRPRAFIAESVGAATESEEPSVALAAAENGGRLLRRCRRCGSYSSCQPTFRLPGEPQSAAHWCDNCPGKPFHALPSGDVGTASSTKRRRVDGDSSDAAEPRVARRLAGPEDPSSNAALRRIGSAAANNPDRERNKLQPTNAAGGARTTQKRRVCVCGSSQPAFGLPGEPASSARWCSDCPDKSSRAVNIKKNKRCLCGSSQPSFGLPGGPGSPAVARWCSKCPDKPANAVDVKHKRCMCNTSIPNFGLPGEPAAAARWCSKCPDKPPNAIDVKNKRCQCGSSQPSLGLPGDAPTAARWCSKCPNRPHNAVGVKSKRCKCGISQPSFGLPGERANLARWCLKCPDKAPNAVNLKSKKCRCGSSVPSFGLLGEPPSAARWCSKCPDKAPNAIDVKNKKQTVCLSPRHSDFRDSWKGARVNCVDVVLQVPQETSK